MNKPLTPFDRWLCSYSQGAYFLLPLLFTVGVAVSLSWLLVSFLIVMVCFPSGFVIVAYLVGRAKERARLRIHSLEASHNLGSIGELLDLLTLDDVYVTSRAARILTKLLLRVNPGEMPQLTSKQLRRLYRAVTDANEEFALSALHAVEFLGDARALPRVKGMAAGKWLFGGLLIPPSRKARMEREAGITAEVLERRLKESSAVPE
jgi:hypothetical protein